jgi:6-phosphogluconolactonase (cycloisomerase 2 family)
VPLGRSPVFVALDSTGNFLFVGNGLSANLSEFAVNSSGLAKVDQSPYATPSAPTALTTVK